MLMIGMPCSFFVLRMTDSVQNITAATALAKVPDNNRHLFLDADIPCSSGWKYSAYSFRSGNKPERAG